MARLCRGIAIAAAVVLAACGFPLSETPIPRPVVPAPPSSACADAAEPPEAPVYAFFHCAGASTEDDPRPVPRAAHAADPISHLDAAMIGLVGGPTDAERDAGYTSFFSVDTQLAVRGVAIGEDGTAIVDFEDIRPFMNNASTSAGSAGLLAQLNATVFQIEEITAVEYRIEASCDAFWEWLQRTCAVVRRP